MIYIFNIDKKEELCVINPEILNWLNQLRSDKYIYLLTSAQLPTVWNTIGPKYIDYVEGIFFFDARKMYAGGKIIDIGHSHIAINNMKNWFGTWTNTPIKMVIDLAQVMDEILSRDWHAIQK